MTCGVTKNEAVVVSTQFNHVSNILASNVLQFSVSNVSFECLVQRGFTRPSLSSVVSIISYSTTRNSLVRFRA